MAEMKDTMSKVAGNRGALEQLLLQVPGFKGYLKAEYRRESDKIHREYLAQRLGNTKKAVDEVKVAMVDDGRLDGLDDLDTLLSRLDKVISRVKYADYGESGFFDTVKIDDQALQTLAEVDLALVNYVVEIEDAMGKLEADVDEKDLKKAVKNASQKIKQLDEKIDQREHIVTGVI